MAKVASKQRFVTRQHKIEPGPSSYSVMQKNIFFPISKCQTKRESTCGQTCCSQCLRENISCIHLKFVPEGLNPNEGLVFSSPGYTVHFVAITVFSVKIGVSIPSGPKNYYQREWKKTGTGHGKAMVVIVNVRTHLLELSGV